MIYTPLLRYYVIYHIFPLMTTYMQLAVAPLLFIIHSHVDIFSVIFYISLATCSPSLIVPLFSTPLAYSLNPQHFCCSLHQPTYIFPPAIYSPYSLLPYLNSLNPRCFCYSLHQPQQCVRLRFSLARFFVTQAKLNLARTTLK